MIDIRRLQQISVHNENEVLRFVADFILRKTQRDQSEFYRYLAREDWKELDSYLYELEEGGNASQIELARKLIAEVIDPMDVEERELSFEKELLSHWNSSY